MTLTHTWKYRGARMQVAPLVIDGQTLNNVVTDVLFTITVSDGTNSCDYQNETPVPLPTDPAKFTAIGAATAVDRLSWAQDAIADPAAPRNQAWFEADADVIFNAQYAPAIVMAPPPD